jgi:hypothetical protein
MIQRIQSIYLLLASALFGGSYYLPFAHANVTPTPNTAATNAFADSILGLPDSQLGQGCVIVAAIFCLIAIFRYHHRLRQISTIGIAFLGGIIGAGAMVYAYITDGSSVGGATPDFGGLLILVALLCCVLAIRAVRKDEHLVKSMDRLR